jgi:predicted alpha/beta-fold hydrolase
LNGPFLAPCAAVIPTYRPPWWLPGAHLQTIVPARVLGAPDVNYRRERWDTPDGDFIDVDFALPQPVDEAAPLVVHFHGLEGDSASHYARGLMHQCGQRGWRGLVVHFRGCSGEDNRLPRAYHSGDSAEIDWILERVATRWSAARRFAVGISLGGNALAKWAGEYPERAPRLLAACAAVSAPFDLAAGGAALEKGFSRVYAAKFMRTLRPKAIAKARRFPGLADTARIAASTTIREFDDAFTAPVHGFAGVSDYWRRASAKPWLAQIPIPMLALNARNDPFVPGASLPTAAELSAFVTLDAPRQGGHVGFVAAPRGPGRRYLTQRVFAFLEQHA